MERPADSPTDADLLRAYLLDRDDAAFGRLVARHARAARRVAYRHTRHEQAAEDVAQAAFIVLARRPRSALRSARRKGTALPWVAKVCRYAAANWRRAEQRRGRREKLAARPDVTGDPTAGRDLAEAVGAALSALPRRERRLVRDRHLNELPWDEVARRHGTTPEAARKAGSRALVRLRDLLEARGITATGAAVLAGLRALAAPSSTSAASVAAAGTSPILIARGVLTTMKLQTAAVTTAALLTTAGLVTTAAAFLQADPPPAARPAAGMPGLTGTLSDGTTVNLYAMGDQDGNWWTPDGAEAVEIDYDGSTTVIEDDQIGVAAAMRIARPSGRAVEDVGFDVPGGFLGVMDASGDVGHLVGYPAQPDGEPTRVAVRVPVGEAVDVGRASAEYLAQSPIEGAGVRVSFSPLGRYRPWGNDETTFTTLFIEGDTAGRRVEPSLVMKDGSVRRGGATLSRLGDPAIYTFNFGDADPAEAEAVVVALQPLETVQFENLAKRRDLRTEPAVEVLDHAATAAALGGEAGPLARPMATPIDLDQVPLEEVVDYLRNVTGVGFFVDYKALEAAGVGRDTEVTFQVPAGTTLDKVLDLMLSQLGGPGTRVTHGYDDGIVTITVADDAD